MSVEDPQSSHLGNMESIICCSLSLSLLSLVIERRKNHVDMGIIYKMIMMHVYVFILMAHSGVKIRTVIKIILSPSAIFFKTNIVEPVSYQLWEYPVIRFLAVH